MKTTSTDVAKTTVENEDCIGVRGEEQNQEQVRSQEDQREDNGDSKEHLGRIHQSQEESGMVPDRHPTEVECRAPILGGPPRTEPPPHQTLVGVEQRRGPKTV